MKSKSNIDIISLRFFVLIFSLCLNKGIQMLIETAVIKNEDIIAHTSPLFLALSLPMGFYLFFLGRILVNRFYKKKRSVTDNAMLSQLTETEKRNAQRFLPVILIIAFIICSLCLYCGISKRTVITSALTVKDYSVTGELKEEYKPENINFVKIYPEASYARYSGFESIYTVIEIYISENDCFCFTSDEFKSFEDMIQLKNAIEEKGAKIYIRDRAENDPDPEEYFLTDEEILYIENFYAQYESLK